MCCCFLLNISIVRQIKKSFLSRSKVCRIFSESSLTHSTVEVSVAEEHLTFDLAVTFWVLFLVQLIALCGINPEMF